MINDNKHPDGIYVFIICIPFNDTGSQSEYTESSVLLCTYRGADKNLARPESKQATATEDFDFHVSYL
jgi:hypothetical protein